MTCEAGLSRTKALGNYTIDTRIMSGMGEHKLVGLIHDTIVDALANLLVTSLEVSVLLVINFVYRIATILWS